jgi:radical SAM superfamily enzyme YgiQ (UPF0313 family)
MRKLPLVSATAAAPVAGAMQPQRVVLLGPIQQEPLALQYLAAAVRRAGHEAYVVPYANRADLGQALADTLALAPDLVGLGIAFQNHIDEYLLFIRKLREAGFLGHLTAGGHVPTFCYRELLADLPELDSVVRHDGEETLVEMLKLLESRQPVRGLRGLVWREAGQIAVGPIRTAAPDLDELAWPERSSVPYTVGGLTVDFVITARGCVGECNYCSIAAYTSEQKKRYRLRRPEAVAEEVAMLHRERGARVIFIQDDLFVLPSEAKTIERTERLSEALRQRGVSDLVFWLKGRPETITPRVAEALARMGTIHLFLGVESANAERLAYLGRTHQPTDNEAAIAACRAAGIMPSFNFMLFDPDSSLEDLEATLSLADRHLDLSWNVCRTEIYSGTALRERLELEGRLRGDYRTYGYEMRDPRAEVLFRILRVSLNERALSLESLLNRLISLSFSRQLHEVYFPGETSAGLARRAMQLGIEARRDTLRAIREAAAFVAESDVHDSNLVRRFAVSQALAVNRADAERRHQVEELWQHLHLRGLALMKARGVRSYPRVQADFGIASGS